MVVRKNSCLVTSIIAHLPIKWEVFLLIFFKRQSWAWQNRKEWGETINSAYRPGIQYVCREYVEATVGMKRSYSKKTYPWDNACIESFHVLIKREWLNRFKIKNYEHAYKLVFESIETFYNTVRIHSHCGYLSPNEYENVYEQKLNKMEKLAGWKKRNVVRKVHF